MAHRYTQLFQNPILKSQLQRPGKSDKIGLAFLYQPNAKRLLIKGARILALLLLLSNAVQVTAQGKIAFTSDRDGYIPDIYTMNANGSAQTNVTNSPDAIDLEPAFSPDQRKIVFRSSPLGLNNELYIMNADGSGVARLTYNADALYEVEPSFSPNGRKIVFAASLVGQSYDIYIMNVDGSGITRLTNNPANDANPSFSPDGRTIVFHSNRDGNIEVYVMNVDGSHLVRLTNNPATDAYPVFSPDGRKITFTSDRNGKLDIYLMNVDGSGVTRLTNNPANDGYSVFSPDGSKIAFLSDRDGNDEIYAMNANGSNQVNLTNNPSDDYVPSWGTVADTDGDGVPDLYDCEPLNKKVAKYIVCHDGLTLCVDKAGFNDHLNHGDKFGRCGATAKASEIVQQIITTFNVAISTYPNPNKGQFSLQLNNTKANKAEVLIADAKGVTVERRHVQLTAGKQTLSFNLGNKATGLYMVKVISEEGVQTIKVAVQR